MDVNQNIKLNNFQPVTFVRDNLSLNLFSIFSYIIKCLQTLQYTVINCKLWYRSSYSVWKSYFVLGREDPCQIYLIRES